MEKGGSAGGSAEALTVLVGALVFGTFGLGWTCLLRSWCLGTKCRTVNTDVRWPGAFCSFATIVGLESALIQHNNQSMSNLMSLTRGVCGVGERFTLSSVTNQPTCILQRPFPDALNLEIMDPSASTYHERACGQWLSSGLAIQPSLMQSPEFLSFEGGNERAAAIRNAEAEIYSGSRLSSTNLGKFRAACHRAVLAGSEALLAAGNLAYVHLVNAAAVDSVTTEEGALQALGTLVGHYCDGPLVMGYNLAANGFSTTVYRGKPFSQDVLAQALYLVQQPSVLQEAAEAANTYINSYVSNNAPTFTYNTWKSKTTQVLRGATERTDDAKANMIPCFSRSSSGWCRSFSISDSGYTHQFEAFVYLAQTNLTRARSYLHGIAATCSFSFQSLVTTPGYTATGLSALSAWYTRIRAERPRGAALGHLHAPKHYEPLFETEAEDVANASTILISQLRALSNADANQLVGGQASDAESVCLDFTRMMFPDEIDSIQYELVISPTLYSRMEVIISQVRAGVAHVLRNNANVRGALLAPDVIANYVENVRIRIPGAPRGTWAASTRSAPIAQLSSTDGVFVMAAKQARAVFLERQASMVYEESDVCEAPPHYAPLVANAYILPHWLCSYYLLGMSLRPWSDELYDDESLVSRFGWIIAHELAHMNMKGPGYQAGGAAALLWRYPHAGSQTNYQTRNEAFADVLAALGVFQTGLVNASKLCEHVSQLWCARMPLGFVSGNAVHPPPNSRGDSLCETLVDLGLM